MSYCVEKIIFLQYCGVVAVAGYVERGDFTEFQSSDDLAHKAST